MIGERYTLDREIGRGGMGAVWLGRDEVLGRAVAIKLVGAAAGVSSPDALRAEREARIAASLNHPNIVGVFDLVAEADQQYLVMEYVEGRTLAELIREQGPLHARQAAGILAQASAALAAAHDSGIVHRDVKPSNILVRDDGLVKLSDFGIARTESDDSLTQTGMVTGSPAYLAPEVASGRPATPASDVWSLGASLFHALAGRPPYEVGDNLLGTLYQIVNEPPPRLPDAGELAPVLLATMAHDPRARWSMEDIARVLDLVSTGKHAAVPGPPSPPPAFAPRVVPAEPAPAPEASQPTRAVRRMPPRASGSTAVLTSAPSPARRAAATPGRRRRVLPLIVAGLVAALVVAIVVLALADDPQDTPSGAGTTPTTSDGSPDEESSGPSTPPTEAELEAFVSGYLETADADPAQGFEQLTPAFQRMSGGLDGYEGFWGNVSDVELVAVTSDPADLTVSYTYRYNYLGAGVRTDDVSLQLRRSGDGYLIAGEA